MPDTTHPPLPAPFCYYKAILKGDHFHFGLWKEEGPHQSAEEAQQEMFAHLLSFFPPPPAKVLDVGCGLGLSASLLSGKGYAVTAIAPSPEMIEYARRTYEGSGVDFGALGFFDHDETVFSKGQYDVLFFQESAQYLTPLGDLMKKARWLLKENGVLIMGDEVCYDRSIKPETSVHLSFDFTVELSGNGFCITEHGKIGKQVLPTFDFVIDGFSTHFDEIVSASDDPATRDTLLFYLDSWKKQKLWHSTNRMGYEIFVARKDHFFIRPYAPGDETQILGMFRKTFGVERTLEHWYWEYRDNPYGRFMISEAFSEAGKLVVHYGGYPVPFFNATGVGARTFLSYQGGDTMTLPEVRNVGLGKTNLLSRTAHHLFAAFLERQIPFAYGINTGKIKVLGKRYLGYHYLDEVVFWARDIVKNPFKKPGWPNIFGKYKVEEVGSFTREWDEFFERVSDSYRFLVRRDAKYLKWRYLDGPDKDYRIFCVRRWGRLVGWSVFLAKENKFVWGDALFDERCPEAVRHLLYAVQASPAAKGAERIEGWFSHHPSWWNEVLRANGFEVGREPNRLSLCYKIFDEPDMSDAIEQSIYYSSGDSDLF